MGKKAKPVPIIPSKNLPMPLAGFIVLLSSLAFTFWWKLTQLKFISTELVGFYPLLYWIHTLVLGTILFFCLWYAWRGLLFFLFDTKNKKWKSSSSIHVGVFFLILIAHIIYNGFFSPLNWDNPIAALNKGESVVNTVCSTLRHVFSVNSKANDLSGFELSSLGSLPLSPSSGRSPVFGAINWLFDIPSADLEGFYRIILIFFFGWFVIGSFGFYLFTYLGLGLSLPVSISAGLLYTLANHSLSLLASHYVPFFTGVFLCLPYALLFIRLAFKHENWRYALLSGTFLSLNLYLLMPHPESITHGAFFWVSYVFYLASFSHSDLSLKSRLKLVMAAFLSFFFGCLYAYGPVIQSALFKEIHLWGHLDGILVRYNFAQAIQGVLTPFLVTFALLLILFGIGFKKLKSHLNKSSDFWFFFAWLVFLALCFLPGNDGPFIKLLMQIHFKRLSFLGADRVFLFFSLSALVPILYGIEYALKEESISEDIYKGLCILAVVVPVFISYKNTEYSYFLMSSGIAIIALICFILKKKFNKFEFRTLFLMLAVLFALVNEGSSEWVSVKLADNKNNCKYYLSLRGLAIKARFIPEDAEANNALLQKKLLTFEESLSKSVTGSDIRERYRALLSSAGATSASAVSKEKWEIFLPAAAFLADELYLKEPVCPYPKGFGGIYDPNSVVLFDKVKDRYSRIMGLTGFAMDTGIGEGLMINDATAGVDTRFMWAYPSSSALYFFPGDYYQDAGNYESLMLGRQKISIFSTSKNRKLFNIAGMDVLLATREDFNALKQKDGLDIIENDIPSIVLLENRESYGIAYLAKHLVFQKPRDLTFMTNRPPFDKTDTARFENYKNTVDALTDELAALPQKHSAIIETNFEIEKDLSDNGENKFTIAKILGNKAAFKVNCKTSPCRLVFNQSQVTGWKAFADNTPLKIERANFAFLSVDVPKGEHLVWFEHRPAGVIWGVLLTTLSYLTTSYFIFKKKLPRPNSLGSFWNL